MIRTRFAPSPTGFMHIGNLRTALYEYLIAKSAGGQFILRIEDTDQNRLVKDAEKIIFDTLKISGLKYDEGPDIGGEFGPYIQSQRKFSYLKYALQLIDEGKSYYCFCDKERLDSLHKKNLPYDRHCRYLSQEQIQTNLDAKIPYVIRQIIPEGKTTFKDEVYGQITVDNSQLDDQILIKSDGLPTYNFANVIDDHLMQITHVVRGCEYLSSTPKYNLLYEAFGWQIPVYVHLPLILDENGEKLSKRKSSASFQDLIQTGFLPETIINYIALLGWSPENNREFFTLKELENEFKIKGLSKSPAIFDLNKLRWMNGEYIKNMDESKFYELVLPHLKNSIQKSDLNYKQLAKMSQSRINFVHEAPDLFDFIDKLPNYDTSLFIHKKMKTNLENSLDVLKIILPKLHELSIWTEDSIKELLMETVNEMNLKTGQIFWPLRTALSGKESTPCGATEIAQMLGKSETIKRINIAIEKLTEGK